MGIKLTPQAFYAKYYPYAKKIQDKTGLNALAQLTQAALESGWDEHTISQGNLFGVKDTDGVNGNEVLVTTLEVLDKPTYKFPVIISITKYGAKWLYKVKDYFRKYDTIEAGFEDHAKFFVVNTRYANAWKYREDATVFLGLVADAGYATSPTYKNDLLSTLRWFQNYSKIVK